MKQTNYRLQAFLTLTAVFTTTLLIYQNCGSKVTFSQGPTDSSLSSTADTGTGPIVDPTAPVSCDAINPDPSVYGLCKKGFIGNLYAQPRNSLIPATHGGEALMAGVGDVDDYLRKDWLQPVTVTMQDLNVPPTNFKAGFATSQGVLQIDDGTGNEVVLNEFFALDLYGVFRLNPAVGDEPGEYQFALISDDGSKLYTKLSGQTDYSLLIDDQKPLTVDTGIYLRGSQAARMGCSTDFLDTTTISTVTMTATSAVALKVDWYQGPREGIALQLMYRKVPSAGAQDALCGKEDGNLFLPTGTDSKALAARGWKVVSYDNLLHD